MVRDLLYRLRAPFWRNSVETELDEELRAHLEHLVKSFLFDTQPNDPGTLALAGVVLLSTAILAGYAPAWRASRIDPLAALRHE